MPANRNYLFADVPLNECIAVRLLKLSQEFSPLS
jgi:hypothetical protein